jgi:hypothetical protein
MKFIRNISIAIVVGSLGMVLTGIGGASLTGISLIDAAHAARPAAHRGAHRTARPSGGRKHVDVDVDRGPGRRDVDVDVNRRGRNVSVDVDVDRRPGVGAVAAGVAVGTAIAAGTRVTTLPAGCATVVTDGVTYHHCGSVHYRAHYEGTNVVYIVVDKP